MKFASKIVIALATIASVAGMASTASADPYSRHNRWEHHRHHRQHEVMVREHHQRDRFHHGRRGDQMSRGDARDLHGRDQSGRDGAIGHDGRTDPRVNDH